MDLAKTSFRFTDGREIEVSESTWETAEARAKIEAKARADRDRLNGSGDPVLLYFLETFYSYMASVSSGDVPSAEEAFALSDADLDGWYSAIIEVNPESFIKVDRMARETVSFRDGSIFEILSAYLPSVIMKRVRLEEEALKREPDRDNPDIWSVYLYPILAACTRPDVPPADEIRKTWPELEIYKWKDAVEALNPHWFGSAEQAEGRTLQETKTLQKKSKKSRARS